jgi:hypothetical protein
MGHDVPDARTGSPSLDIPGLEALEPIGRGGFGTVYRGWQRELRREVAVKVLDAPAAAEGSEDRFGREAMAMGTVSDHPNVVPVYATGTVGGRHYLVMPLLPDSLADQLRSGPMPATDVVRLGRGLADALAAAHQAGVLHRDVKPANVLRTPYGAHQLADFGVARFVDATHTTGAPAMATVGYAAPEILAGEPASEVTDVYSLGATLHAAATGRGPYEARPDEAPIALAMRVMHDDPPRLAEAGVPATLAAVIERAMARDPADRYPSAAALRDALDEVEVQDQVEVGDHAGVGPVAAPAATSVFAPATEAGATEAGSPTTVAAAGHGTEVVPDASPGAAPAGPRPAQRDGGGRRVALVAVAALVVLAAVALLIARAADDGDPADDVASDIPNVPEADEEAPEAAEGDDAPEPTEAQDAPAEPVIDGAAAEAVVEYYGLLDQGRVDEGFARLSPAYQQRTGEDSYRGFWSTVAGVEVLDASGDDGTVVATIRYTLTDGRTSTERTTLRVVSDDSGTLLIDDHQVG